jgi:hypothetical protein
MEAYKCQYCGQDTSEVDIDYLVDFDHLSCALNAEQKQRKETNPIEQCVMCGADTQYRFHDHIDTRIGYIEGAGQLCTKCWNKGTERRHMTIPMNLVYDTPNDQELGAAVRRLYYENNS